MKAFILMLLLIVLTASPTFAGDLANGERLARNCAVCHGAFGQGASGKLSPRLAGLPKEYLIKATKDYLKGDRPNSLMVITSELDKMSDKEMEDIAEYYSSLDINSDARFAIRAHMGDAKKGKKIYRDECKVCHASDGFGKPKKDAPPLAMQHPEYLFTVMRGFRDKYRIHDNDPEDDSFEEYTDEDYIDLTAYMASLGDVRIKKGYRFVPPQIKLSRESSRLAHRASKIEITNITQTVVRMELADGMTAEKAAETMLAQARKIGLKKVAQQRVSRFLEKKGVKTPHLSIYQFCNPMDARQMVMADPVFSAYMPCRISIAEDRKGKLWLMMLNLDMLINSEFLPDDVVKTAVKVNQQMLSVMAAGARGKLID